MINGVGVRLCLKMWVGKKLSHSKYAVLAMYYLGKVVGISTFITSLLSHWQPYEKYLVYFVRDNKYTLIHYD